MYTAILLSLPPYEMFQAFTNLFEGPFGVRRVRRVENNILGLRRGGGRVMVSITILPTVMFLGVMKKT